ncbi:cytochrome b/b6 domain-containing protein [Candidimonas nitroreducens]|uniref:Hydrogenase n=1 Tax=Candidimonas nitroreducens TaxID=683354 RepID=A0A225MWG4_9BURK|nr:cytochrome b/b6 domain-containing protein [Candidimonas nitroreducens]OWT65636.1 hydrogenase [Candidimonas nitroreducens]
MKDAGPPGRPGLRPVRVWDLPTRLFHWLAVILVAAAYASVELDRMDWHVRIGEALLALVIFRLLWGCFGSASSRFRNFVATPGAALRHLRHLLRREPDLQVGHNPAGGWMVLLLLALLLGETLSGLYINNDVADDGPFTSWVPAWAANAITALHSILWYALLAAVLLHVLAIAVYAVAKGHDLLRPMLTGRKQLPPEVAAPRMAPAILTWLALLAGAAAAILLAAYL